MSTRLDVARSLTIERGKDSFNLVRVSEPDCAANRCAGRNGLNSKTCSAVAVHGPFSIPPYSSVLDDLIDPVNDTRYVAEKLEQKRPQHFDAWTLLDEHGQERKYQTEKNQ
jgi:hypothetical protein